MIAVVHQAVGKHGSVETRHRPADNGQKTLPVFIIIENRFAPVSTGSHVIDRAGKFDSEGTGHETDFRKEWRQ